MMRTLTLAAVTCGLLAVAGPAVAFGETDQTVSGAGRSAQTGRDHDGGDDDGGDRDGRGRDSRGQGGRDQDGRDQDGRGRNAEAGYGRGWHGDRDGSWRGSGRGAGRSDDRQERRGAGAGGRMAGDGDGDMAGHGRAQGGWHGGQGSRFMLTTGTTRLTVICAPREILRDCVEAATLLLDRATRVPASAAGTGSAMPPAETAPKAP